MKKNFVTTLFLILFLISCSKGDQKGQDDDNLQTISIKEGEISQIADKDVFNAIHFVKLETTDSCLIGGQIEQLEIFDDKIYILDKNAQIFVFDRSGKFVQRIGKRGLGPEEYVNATHFYIHPYEKCFCVYDASTSYIIRYALDGAYLNRTKAQIDHKNIIVTHINLLDKEHVLIQPDNSPTSLYNYVVLKEADGITQSYHLPYLSVGDNSSSQYKANNCIGKNFYATRLLTDTIYKWAGDRFIPKFILETGLKHASKEVLDKYAPYFILAEAKGKLNKNGYSMGIERLFSTDDYLHLKYAGLGYFDAIFWKFSTNQGYLFRTKYDSNPLLLFYHNLMSTSKDALIRYLTAEELYLWEKEIRACNHPEVSNLYKNLKEEDNPVLVFYDYNKLLNRFK